MTFLLSFVFGRKKEEEAHGLINIQSNHIDIIKPESLVHVDTVFLDCARRAS